MGTVCPVKTVVLPPCVAPAAAPPVPAPAPVPAAVPPAAAAPIAVTTPAAPPCEAVFPRAVSNIPWRFTTSSSKSACSSSDTPFRLPVAAAAFALFNSSVALVTSLAFASWTAVRTAPVTGSTGRLTTLVFEFESGLKISPMFVATLLRPCAGSLMTSHAPVAADLTTV